MTDPADLNAMARRVIDANHYMTVATRDPDGQARLSPVYYTAARYSDLGEVEAVYLSADARAIEDEELDTACAEAFRTTAGAHRFAPDELRGSAELRL